MRSRRASHGNSRRLNCGVMRMLRVSALVLMVALGGCVTTYTPEPSEVCAHISDATERSVCDSNLVAALAQARSDTPRPAAISSGAAWLALLWYPVYYAIGIAFGLFVYRDAKRREWLAFRVRPFWWGAVCLFDPAIGALVYWVLHYSRLVRRGIA